MKLGRQVRFGVLSAVALAGALSACAAPAGEDAASSTGALGQCARAKVAAEDGLWLRGAPSTSGASVVAMPFDATVDVIERTSDGAWARVRFAGQEGWAFAAYLACSSGETPSAGGGSPGGACPAGQERHAYVHTASAALLASASTGAPTSLLLPFGAKLITRGVEGELTKVIAPSLDVTGRTDRVEGYVASSALAASSRCAESGLLRKADAGARHLLGQYSLSRAAGSNNAKNATLGLNRLDGASVANGAALTYLDRVADDRRGTVSCTSDASCDGADVCHQRGVCGPYYFGISTQGTELWGSGVCGTATTLHRAALDASLLPSAYTNHSRFPGSYGYPGADAEVAWWSAGPPSTGQHYKFFNDSGGTVVVVGGSRIKGSELEMTVQLWGSNADARYSEHQIVSTGEGRMELRRKLTRIGTEARTSPWFPVEGGGHIRRVGEPAVTTLADGRVATTEEWRIDSAYVTQVRVPNERFLSRNHPEAP